MTRMAPKPAGYTRTVQSRASACAEIRWRVARTGTLVLALEPLSTGADGALELAVEASLEFAGPDVRHEGAAGGRIAGRPFGQPLKGRGRLSNPAGEATISVELGTPADACISAAIVLLERPETGEILGLTDLPARMGLRGGTYVLDAASVRQALGALRGFGRGC